MAAHIPQIMNRFDCSTQSFKYFFWLTDNWCKNADSPRWLAAWILKPYDTTVYRANSRVTKYLLIRAWCFQSLNNLGIPHCYIYSLFPNQWQLQLLIPNNVNWTQTRCFFTWTNRTHKAGIVFFQKAVLVVWPILSVLFTNSYNPLGLKGRYHIEG